MCTKRKNKHSMLHGLTVASNCIGIIWQTMNLATNVANYVGRVRGWEVYGNGAGDCERELIFHSGQSIDND